jgi:hypothetical protein
MHRPAATTRRCIPVLPAHSASAVKDLLSSPQKIYSPTTTPTLFERFHTELGTSRRFARQRTCGLSARVVWSRVGRPPERKRRPREPRVIAPCVRYAPRRAGGESAPAFSVADGDHLRLGNARKRLNTADRRFVVWTTIFPWASGPVCKVSPPASERAKPRTFAATWARSPGPR